MYLVDKRTFEALQAGEKAYLSNPDAFASQYSAFILSYGNGENNILSIVNGEARIRIEGVLTNKPSFYAMMFGGGNTTYPEIIDAIKSADANESVKKIVLNIDSGGGNVSGLFDLTDTIQAAKKEIIAVTDFAASAAYAIAASTDKIIAKSRASMFGSIGVVSDFYIDESVVSVTSTDAPEKRPDVTKESGLASVRKTLDSLHELFVDAIATGRSSATGKKITAKKVNSDFGRGAMFVAGDAIDAGMIDEIQGYVSTEPVIPADSGDQPQNAEAFMDANKLKAEFPLVYAEIQKDALAKERDRVNALLIAGEKSGDMARAVKAITEGEEMTATLSTHFMMAAVAKSDISNRAAETANVQQPAAQTSADVSAQDKALSAALSAELGIMGDE